MATVLKCGATYDDLRNVPDDVVAELVEGELYASPRPASRHGRAATILSGRLASSFDDAGTAGPGGWWIVNEPELHLRRDVLVPDLAAWRRERMPEYPDVAAFELTPDWVCEVISPSTGHLDRMRKVPLYAAHGVHYLWIVDPLHRIIEAYRRDGDDWMLLAVRGGDEAARIEPFDAIEIPLSTLWA